MKNYYLYLCKIFRKGEICPELVYGIPKNLTDPELVPDELPLSVAGYFVLQVANSIVFDYMDPNNFDFDIPYWKYNLIYFLLDNLIYSEKEEDLHAIKRMLKNLKSR